MRLLLLVSLAMLALPIARAACQEAADRPRSRAPSGPPVERVTLESWDEATSRRLFAAADRNCDDRLDLFEAASAFDSFTSARETQRFRRLDTDRDGYVEWPEFDRCFRDSVADGGTFSVRPSRRLPAPEPVDSAPPARRVLRLWDTDGSGGLSPDELMALLQSFGAPAVHPPFAGLDRDGSGSLSESELAPFLQFLPRSTTAETGKGKVSGVDRNGDGRIDVAELEAALRRLDPSLAPWAGPLLARKDRNGDGYLDATELERATPTVSQTVVEPRAHR